MSFPRKREASATADGIQLLIFKTEHRSTIAEAARNARVNTDMLGRWKREIERDEKIYQARAVLKFWNGSQKWFHKENQRLKMEHEIFKKGGGLLCQRVRVRYRFIDKVKKAYPITLLCSVMRMSRSGYYALGNEDKSFKEKLDSTMPVQ